MHRRLWALAGAALVVRAISAATLAVVAPDGARNLRMARLILEGAWTESLTIYPLTHPLYPIFAALGEAVTGAALFSGLAVSVILGGLTVIPLYHLARRAWNERVATITSVLYIFLPKVVELHGDAMLEGTFFFFFFSGMALSLAALDRKSWELAALAGASIACAWLTRPEGVYLVPLLLLAAALRPSRFALAAVPIALATALVLAMPYQGFIKAQTGKYGVSANPLSTGMLGLFTGSTDAAGYSVSDKTAEEFKEYADIRRFGRVGGPVVTVAKETSGNLFHALVPFVLIGLFVLRRSGPKWREAAFLFAGIAGYYLPTMLAFVAGTPFSHRYILVPCILMLPLAALGLIQAAAWMRHRHALVALLAALSLAMAVQDVRPRRADKVGIKQAGLALRQRLGENARILSPSRQVEFYARGEFVDLPGGATFDDIRKLIAGKPMIHAIALHLSDFRNLEPGLQEKLDQAFEALGTYPPEGGKNAARVYLTQTLKAP